MGSTVLPMRSVIHCAHCVGTNPTGALGSTAADAAALFHTPEFSSDSGQAETGQQARPTVPLPT